MEQAGVLIGARLGEGDLLRLIQVTVPPAFAVIAAGAYLKFEI
jgi:hypothetical protein